MVHDTIMYHRLIKMVYNFIRCPNDQESRQGGGGWWELWIISVTPRIHRECTRSHLGVLPLWTVNKYRKYLNWRCTLCLILQVDMTTEEIDALVHREIIRHDAYPSPLGYGRFPKSVCTSVNNVLCHGIPDRYSFFNNVLFLWKLRSIAHIEKYCSSTETYLRARFWNGLW